MLALGGGQLPGKPVLATLGVRRWGSKHSYYTLDRKGERLIVNPIGGRYKHEGRNCSAYRSWSGQGSTLEDTPVAYSFKGFVEDQASNGEDVEDDLEINDEKTIVQASKSAEDPELLPINSGSSYVRSEASQSLGDRG